MAQQPAYRVQERAALSEPFSAKMMRRVESIFEWLATYPPYTPGCEESSLLFDEYRAFNLAQPPADGRRTETVP